MTMEKTENNKVKYILGFFGILVPAAVALFIHFDSKAETIEKEVPSLEINMDSSNKSETIETLTQDMTVTQPVSNSKNVVNNEGTIGTIIQNNTGSISIENNFKSEIDTIDE